MNVLSLFDGMSCGRIALERAGIKVDKYFASEIDSHAIKVSNANYPDIIQIGDVKKVSYCDGVLSSGVGDFLVDIDLVIGGSPCQGFSFAGKQLAFDDPRSALYFKFEDVVSQCNPKYFLLENVRMKKEHEDIITKGRGVNPITINSNLVSAQNRERLYWTNIPDVAPPEDNGITLKAILDVPEGSKIYTKKKPDKPKANQLKSGCLTAGAHSAGNHSDMDVIVYDPSQVPVNASGRIDIHGPLARRYSCEECERLQTVPEGYTKGVSDSQRYKLLGNGWTVDVITHIFKNLPKGEKNDYHRNAYTAN